MPKPKPKTEEEPQDDIYEEEVAEEELEDDEISPDEAGFIEGYSGSDAIVRCANCNKFVDVEGKLIERVHKGQTLRFCTPNCAESYAKRKG